MSEYVEGFKLILVVIAVLLRLNGLMVIYMKRDRIWVLPPLILNLFSPLLCIIITFYVTSKGWEGLGRGNTFGDVLTLIFILLGSQIFSGMIFVSGLFVMGIDIPGGRALGPGADPFGFEPLYLLAVIGLSSLILLCMLRIISPGTPPREMMRGKDILSTTLIVYGALIPVQLLIIGYGWVLGDAGFSSPSNPFMSFDGTSELVVLFTAIVVVAPLVEELFFRGYLFKLLEEKLGDNPAVIITAILFAVVHFNIYTFLPILVLGGLMGWARKRTGSIVPSLALHMLNNLAALLVVFVS